MKNELKFSFEFFPTKNASDEDVTWKSLKKLESFNPEFFSVTFGAGGGERGRRRAGLPPASEAGRAAPGALLPLAWGAGR